MNFYEFWKKIWFVMMMLEAEERGLRVKEFINGERENCYAKSWMPV